MEFRKTASSVVWFVNGQPISTVRPNNEKNNHRRWMIPDDGPLKSTSINKQMKEN